MFRITSKSLFRLSVSAALIALMPLAAKADDECGLPVAGVVNCNGAFPAGVRYVNSGQPLTINFNDGSSVTDNLVNAADIILSTNGDLTANVAEFASIAALAGGDSGLRINKSAGTGEIRVNIEGQIDGFDVSGVAITNDTAELVTVNVFATAILGTEPGGGQALSIIQRGGADTLIQADGVFNGGLNGINVRNDGAGIVSINQSVSSVITSQVEKGIRILQTATSTGVTQLNLAGQITGITEGVFIENQSATGGAISITANGIINGGSDGISVSHLGVDEATIVVNGQVTAGSGYAITASTVAGNTTNIQFGSGAVLSATSNNAISNNEGNSVIQVADGASITGNINLGDGTDELTLVGDSYQNITLFDGGDDSSLADGFIDTLRFQSGNVNIAGAIIQNWERLIVDGGRLHITDNNLSIGDGSFGSGLELINNAVLDASGLVVNGNLSNTSGQVSLQNNVLGDLLVINGDYAGGGRIFFDVDFANAVSDTVQINGDVVGHTEVTVNPIGLTENLTNNVLIIDVNGNNLGSYSFSQPIAVGAYEYDITQVGNDVFLQRSGFISTASSYELYPQVLLNLSRVDSLIASLDKRNLYANSPHDLKPLKFWLEVDGGYSRFNPDRSSIDNAFNIDSSVKLRQRNLRLGWDWLNQRGDDRFILSASFVYTSADADVLSDRADDDIDTDRYGAKLSAALYTANQVYLAGQWQYNRFISDLDSGQYGEIANNNRGQSHVISAEIGRRLSVSDSWSYTPQAQLTYSSIQFDEFQRQNAESVKLLDGNSLEAKLGILLRYDSKQSRQRTETDKSSHLYTLFNIRRELLGGSRVLLEDVELKTRASGWFGELGVGSSATWGKSRHRLYFEALAATNLDRPSGNYELSAEMGVELKF